MQLTDEQVTAIIAWAEKTPQVQAVMLFGSRCKGTARPDSDVDIADYYDERSLGAELQELQGQRERLGTRADRCCGPHGAISGVINLKSPWVGALVRRLHCDGFGLLRHIGNTSMAKIAAGKFVITNTVTALTCSILLAIGCANIASASPLHDAAKEGDLARIEQLLAQGADINERAGPATALHYAIQQGHVKAAELLINRGADINAA